MMAASVVVMAAVIWIVTRGSAHKASSPAILGLALIVSAGGMAFAKYGANASWSWAIYYTVPALVTVLLPPLALRMSLVRTVVYVALAALTAPIIHYLFVLGPGWDEYMPFLPAPAELFGR